MTLAVGARVEVLSPPPNTSGCEDQIGPGTLMSISRDKLSVKYGETHRVELDSGDYWYYSESQLRKLGEGE